MTWETDAADVDLHLLDGNSNHPHLHSNGITGSTYVTNNTGLGPELVAVRGPARTYPYTINVYYAARRSMGHAMGAVQILEHDGHGRLGFKTLPFVLMRDHTNLDVGTLAGPLLAPEAAPAAK